jgi:hypothetical protein
MPKGRRGKTMWRGHAGGGWPFCKTRKYLSTPRPYFWRIPQERGIKMKYESKLADGNVDLRCIANIEGTRCENTVKNPDPVKYKLCSHLRKLVDKVFTLYLGQ